MFAQDAFEIQVYDSEINKPLQSSMELHFNHVVHGKKESDSPTVLPSDHLTHTTLELALGLKSWWELGAYYQSARTNENDTYYAGVKLRNKLVVPREESGPWHFGINLEVSNTPSNFEESLFGGEVRPILGYEVDKWTFLFNPIFSVAFSTNDQTPEFEPAFKIQYAILEKLGIGPEYYTNLGPINNLPEWSKQSHSLYVTADILNSGFEWNFGVGRGLTAPADDWVAKTIVGMKF